MGPVGRAHNAWPNVNVGFWWLPLYRFGLQGCVNIIGLSANDRALCDSMERARVVPALQRLNCLLLEDSESLENTNDDTEEAADFVVFATPDTVGHLVRH
jgi:hypothetical protein